MSNNLNNPDNLGNPGNPEGTDEGVAPPTIDGNQTEQLINRVLLRCLNDTASEANRQRVSTVSSSVSSSVCGAAPETEIERKSLERDDDPGMSMGEIRLCVIPGIMLYSSKQGQSCLCSKPIHAGTGVKSEFDLLFCLVQTVYADSDPDPSLSDPSSISQSKTEKNLRNFKKLDFAPKRKIISQTVVKILGIGETKTSANAIAHDVRISLITLITLETYNPKSPYQL